ncbi:MAG: hypothetical protein HOD92_26220 [Deltaproteobacteria bacterium]|jgi:hypothetical protein|nr:hypothetical protein [Deltaproteobacteria bacterium]
MVKSELKSIEEIVDMLGGYKKVLNVGCAGCASVCLAGGQREVKQLNTKLQFHFKSNDISTTVDEYTVERQCEGQFLENLKGRVEKYDAVLSMACGAGVQFVAEHFPEIPIFPALNTLFIGVNKEIGHYEERCQACSDCVLGLTGGICPVSMCAKSLFNGPCGGPQKGGKCEVSMETDCAWVAIFERLKKQGRLANIHKIYETRSWKSQGQGKLTLKEYQ